MNQAAAKKLADELLTVLPSDIYSIQTSIRYGGSEELQTKLLRAREIAEQLAKTLV